VEFLGKRTDSRNSQSRRLQKREQVKYPIQERDAVVVTYTLLSELLEDGSKKVNHGIRGQFHAAKEQRFKQLNPSPAVPIRRKRRDFQNQASRILRIERGQGFCQFLQPVMIGYRLVIAGPAFLK